MTEPFIGEIRPFPYNFAPRGWAFCSGQILAIAQNTALFSLLGTTYGGNGQTTFALPDLRGRVPIHQGQGPGLANYTIGELGGAETISLLVNELPAHTHTLVASAGAANATSPTNNLLAAVRLSAYNNGPATSVLSSTALANTGSGTPHENRQPYLVISYCIALEGIFPSRN